MTAAHKLALYCAAALSLLTSASSSIEDPDPIDTVYSVIGQSTLYTVYPTGSMEPTLNEHWYLLVSKVPFKMLKVGDIILWRSGYARPTGTKGKTCSIICHRVVSRSSGGGVLITKGDALTEPDDELVSSLMYVGLVVGQIRRDLVPTPPPPTP